MRSRISPGEATAHERFGASLRQLRQSLGMGLSAAARTSGLNNSSLSLIESGMRPIRSGDLSRLADTYGVSWEALVIALHGQLPMALGSPPVHTLERRERREARFANRITAEEKRPWVPSLLSNYLPKHLEEYKDEIQGFVEDGIADRANSGLSTNRFILWEALNLFLLAVKSNLFGLAKSRTRTIK